MAKRRGDCGTESEGDSPSFVKRQREISEEEQYLNEVRKCMEREKLRLRKCMEREKLRLHAGPPMMIAKGISEKEKRLNRDSEREDDHMKT